MIYIVKKQEIIKLILVNFKYLIFLFLQYDILKKLFSFLLMFILLSFSSVAFNYMKFDFVNDNGDSIDDVKIKGFVCADIQCTQPHLSDLWSGSIKDTSLSSPLNSIVLRIPTQNELNSDAERLDNRYFHLDYLPKYRLIDVISNSIYTNINDPFFPSSHITTSEKISTCSSPITLSVVN